jgi:hypothetical protein
MVTRRHKLGAHIGPAMHMLPIRTSYLRPELQGHISRSTPLLAFFGLLSVFLAGPPLPKPFDAATHKGDLLLFSCSETPLAQLDSDRWSPATTTNGCRVRLGRPGAHSYLARLPVAVVGPLLCIMVTTTHIGADKERASQVRLRVRAPTLWTAYSSWRNGHRWTAQQ